MTSHCAKSRSNSQRILVRRWRRTKRLDLVTEIREKVDHSSYDESSLLTFDLNLSRCINDAGVATLSAAQRDKAAAAEEVPQQEAAQPEAVTADEAPQHEAADEATRNKVAAVEEAV